MAALEHIVITLQTSDQDLADAHTIPRTAQNNNQKIFRENLKIVQNTINFLVNNAKIPFQDHDLSQKLICS